MVEALSQRERRALVVFAVAVIVTAAAAVAYLRSSLPSHSSRVAIRGSIDRSFVTGDLVQYAFTSPSVGWAFDYLQSLPLHFADKFWVFQTVDGGKHWLQQLTGQTGYQGPAPNSMQFFDAKHGFVIVRGSQQQLYRTTDGGARWQLLNLPAPDVTEVAFGGPMYGLLLAGGRPSTLYVTNDGGDTWQSLPDPPADAGNLRLRDPAEAWMDSAGFDAPHIYRSSEGGRSWRRHDLPPPPGTSWTGGGHSASVELLSPRRVVVYPSPFFQQPEVVFHGYQFTSFDQGTTWRYVPAPPGVVAFQDATHWWSTTGTDHFKVV